MKLFSFNRLSYKFVCPQGHILKINDNKDVLGWSVFKSALEGRMFIPICNIPPQEVDGDNPRNSHCKVDYNITFEELFGNVIWVLTYKCPSCGHTVYHSGTVCGVTSADAMPYITMLLQKYLQTINTNVCSVCVDHNKLDLDKIILDGSFDLQEQANELHLIPKVNNSVPDRPQCGLFYFTANSWTPEQGVLKDNDQKCTKEELMEYCTVRMKSDIIDLGMTPNVYQNNPKALDDRNWLVQIVPNTTLTFKFGTSTVRCQWNGFKLNTSVNHKFAWLHR